MMKPIHLVPPGLPGSVIVAAADAAFEGRVRSVLSRPLGEGVQRWGRPLADAADVKAVADRGPAVVILGPEMGTDTAFRLTAQFYRFYPAISVLVVAKPGPDTWQRALITGARAVISPEASDEELRSHLDRALEAARSWAEAGAITGTAAEPAAARVITVISPRGGSGKTIVATNLAVGLAARAPGRVVLVDLDLQFGDISYALMLTPQQTIYDAVSVLDDLDATKLKVFLTRHQSGLYALCAPDEPEASEAITATAISTVITLLASEFGYVIIDTAGGLTEHALAALDLSTDVVLISDMDVPSVRHLRKALDALDQMGMLSAHRIFVLNRANSRVGLDKDDVAAAAKMSIDLELPSSRDVPLSLNEGRPLLSDNPRSQVGRRLAELVDRFVSVPAGRGRGRQGGER